MPKQYTLLGAQLSLYSGKIRREYRLDWEYGEMSAFLILGKLKMLYK